MANKAPGFDRKPDHTITITPCDQTVRVSLNGEVLAQSSRALILQEASYPPVYYMPLDDVIAPATPTQTSTYCPFKGDASYWTATTKSGPLKDVMWAYMTPYDEMRAIKRYVAFYADKVQIETVSIPR